MCHFPYFHFAAASFSPFSFPQKKTPPQADDHATNDDGDEEKEEEIDLIWRDEIFASGKTEWVK